MKQALLWMAAAALCACNRYPESYPPPEQRAPLTAEQTGEAKMFVAASDANAESYFVRDIGGLEAGQWRWTGPNPTLHFVPDRRQGLKFVMDFAVASATYETTGPVTISWKVNGRPLATVRYEGHGDKHFEQAIPAEWIEAGEDVLVSASIRPVWKSPSDGAELGVIFSRAGLVPE